MLSQVYQAVPLAGIYPLAYEAVPLVELGPVVNQAAWDQLYETRGAITPRDKRRADKALGLAYQGLKVADHHVVRLLRNLAAKSRPSAVQRDVLRLANDVLAQVDGKLVEGTPAWESLRALLDVKVDPAKYKRGQEGLYFSDVQLTKLLSKYPFKGSEDVAHVVAVEKLLKQETKNALTNYRWGVGQFTHAEREFIDRVAVELERILGPAPTPDEVLQNAAWGPGTVVGYSFDGGKTGSEMKFASRQTVTPLLHPVACSVVDYYPSWSAAMAAHGPVTNWLEVVPGDQLFTVPKKFEENRCAMKQPSINIWLSRGIGVVIRKRLKSRAGLHLKFQQTVNKEMARIGSLTGVFCTLDLTSASDSNCRAVLRSVLSPAWFAWLYSTASKSFRFSRSPSDKTATQSQSYQMMSSMGCGYTFELETALFLAIARCVVPCCWSVQDETFDTNGVRRVRSPKATYPHVGVNGDDIIIPTAYAEQMISALSLFGFTVNAAKSHYQPGPGFRESCGGDYLFGVAVRPLFFTRRLDDGPAIVAAANRVASHAIAAFGTFNGDKCHRFGSRTYAVLRDELVSFLPKFLHPVLSTPYGSDEGLWELRTSVPESQTGQPDRYRVFVSKNRKIDLETDGVWTNYPDARPFRLDGDNLMASRLSNLSADRASEHSGSWDIVPLGTGQYSVIRGVTQITVGYATKVDREQWHGWR